MWENELDVKNIDTTSDSISENEIEQEKKENLKNQIIEISKKFGLEPTDLTIERILQEESSKNTTRISTETVLQYVMERRDEYEFKLKDPLMARRAISRLEFGLRKYKKDFIERFIDEKISFRRQYNKINRKEIRFLNDLAKNGFYITSIAKEVPEITSLDELADCLEKMPNKISLSIASFSALYEAFGAYILNNPSFEKTLGIKASEDLFRINRTQKDKAVIQFEDLYGVCIFSYDGNPGKNITTETLKRDVANGKIKLMISDIDKCKENIESLQPEVKDKLIEILKEREVKLEEQKLENQTEIQKVKKQENLIETQEIKQQELHTKQNADKELKEQNSNEKNEKKSLSEYEQALADFKKIEVLITDKRKEYEDTIMEGIGGKEQSTRVSRSSLSDTLYAGLTQMGKAEFEHRKELMKRHQQLVSEIQKLEEEIKKPKVEKNDYKMLPVEYYEMDTIEQLKWWRSDESKPYRDVETTKKEEAKKALIEKVKEYREFMGDALDEKANVKIITEFESKVNLIHELDELNNNKYRHFNKGELEADKEK